MLKRHLNMNDLQHVYFRGPSDHTYDRRRFTWLDAQSASNEQFDNWIKRRANLINDNRPDKQVWTDMDRLDVCNALYISGLLRVYGM